MKIGIIGLQELISPGKTNIIDPRVDTLQKMLNSEKKVYLQVEIVAEPDKLKEADGVVAPESAKADLILTDLEFVELRLQRSDNDSEKGLLSRFKQQLDKELMLSEVALTDEESKMISGYPLLTVKPVFLAATQDLEDKNKLLFTAYYSFGYICFFTGGQKDSHAWQIKKGATAWEASGCIHSAIQKGFIKAEVVKYSDLVKQGSLLAARNAGCARFENKDYIVQDGDYIEFKVNK